MTCIGSPHSCSTIKNEWRHVPTSSHAFMACVGLLLSSAQRENEWSSTFAFPMPCGVRRDNCIPFARVCAPVAYLPSPVPKTWLAMPRGNSENSLKCFLPSPWSEVLVVKISSSCEMICIFWTRMVIIMFTIEPYRPLSWARWIHFTLFPAYFFYDPFYCYRLSTPRCSKQCLFLQVFSIQDFVCFLFSVTPATCLVHLIVIDMVTLIILDEKCKPWSFSDAFCIPLSCSNITLFSDFFSL